MRAPRDDAERMAAEIAAHPDQYREMDRLTCDCSPQRRAVAVTYAGPSRSWLWMAGGRTRGRGGFVRVPPRAIPIPDDGEDAAPTLANCPRCRVGYMLVPRPVIVDARRMTPPTFGRVARRR